MISYKLRPLVVALISVMTLQGCATQGQNGQARSMGEVFKDTFNNDDPCANSKRNLGIAIGAIAGAILGGMVSGDKNQSVGILVGALAGSGLGALIGNEIDNRQCEISKVQKKYGVDVVMTPLAIEVQPANASTADASQQNAAGSQSAQAIGLSVSVVDREGKPQFASNSADILPETRAMFLEIAQKYVVAKDDANKKLAEATKSRRVLLIGHTDDSGNSNLNAELSERRAEAVARLFKEAGVPEDMIFYQGAGETLPIADNGSAEGRAKNRRVEIVDLNDEVSFKNYLENRRPNTSYYRPAESVQGKTNVAQSSAVESQANPAAVPAKNKKTRSTAVPAAANTTLSGGATAGSSTTVRNTAASGTVAKGSATLAQPKAKKSVVAANTLDFGGKPFTVANASVNSGGALVESKSSFSLISSANASDISRIATCNIDRPRNAGLVKSLKDGTAYKTAEYLPGMYGRSWYDMVGNNLVVLNKVAVLRDGAIPANKPELKIYSNYKPSSKDVAPDVFVTPDVNTYQTRNGLLYRVFANGERGVQCMDVLLPIENVKSAKDGKLIYGNGAEFVTDFKPKTKN